MFLFFFCLCLSFSVCELSPFPTVTWPRWAIQKCSFEIGPRTYDFFEPISDCFFRLVLEPSLVTVSSPSPHLLRNPSLPRPRPSFDHAKTELIRSRSWFESRNNPVWKTATKLVTMNLHPTKSRSRLRSRTDGVPCRVPLRLRPLQRSATRLRLPPQSKHRKLEKKSEIELAPLRESLGMTIIWLSRYLHAVWFFSVLLKLYIFEMLTFQIHNL